MDIVTWCEQFCCEEVDCDDEDCIEECQEAWG